MKLTHHTTSPRHTRHGFSLIELLVVIVIIGILMALILPAIGRVRYTARVAEVSAEITRLEQALATFQNRFGTYPPSSITLYGTQTDWDANPAAKSVIRSIWPDFDFSTGGRGDQSIYPHPWATADKVLTGDECLVFFLGGVAEYPPGSSVPALRGFSKNSRWPFAVSGENRDGPFYTEFKGERLKDRVGGETVEDQIPSYLDSLPDQEAPIWYSVATNGRYANGEPAYYQTDGNTPWKRDSYQIISPGLDHEFGTILKSPKFKAAYSESTDFSTRKDEMDNITNFSGGLLDR